MKPVGCAAWPRHNEHTIVYEAGGPASKLWYLTNGPIQVGDSHPPRAAAIQARPQWKELQKIFPPRNCRQPVRAGDDSRHARCLQCVGERRLIAQLDCNLVIALVRCPVGKTSRRRYLSMWRRPSLLVRDAIVSRNPRHTWQHGYFTLLGWSPMLAASCFRISSASYAIDLGNDAVGLIDTSPRRVQFKVAVFARWPVDGLHRAGRIT